MTLHIKKGNRGDTCYRSRAVGATVQLRGKEKNPFLDHHNAIGYGLGDGADGVPIVLMSMRARRGTPYLLTAPFQSRMLFV